jgi:predicted HAD superfamily phosphohydrolase YqeG
VRGVEATPWIVVDELPDAIWEAGQRGGVLVVDLENTLVDYGSDDGDRARAMAAAVEAAAVSGAVRHLAFVTNARFPLPAFRDARLSVTAVGRARKPRVRRGPLRHLRSELAGAVVYGDQPLTDGLLARNLGGVWLQPRRAHAGPSEEPWWPRLMRAVGGQLTGRWFAPHLTASLPVPGPARCRAPDPDGPARPG